MFLALQLVDLTLELRLVFIPGLMWFFNRYRKLLLLSYMPSANTLLLVVLNHLLPFSALSRHNFLFLFFYFFSVHIEWVWGGRFSHDSSPTVSGYQKPKYAKKGISRGINKKVVQRAIKCLFIIINDTKFVFASKFDKGRKR
jgi:hypothetical protein